jgi:hypothetical protein
MNNLEKPQNDVAFGQVSWRFKLGEDGVIKPSGGSPLGSKDMAASIVQSTTQQDISPYAQLFYRQAGLCNYCPPRPPVAIQLAKDRIKTADHDPKTLPFPLETSP